MKNQTVVNETICDNQIEISQKKKKTPADRDNKRKLGYLQSLYRNIIELLRSAKRSEYVSGIAAFRGGVVNGKTKSLSSVHGISNLYDLRLLVKAGILELKDSVYHARGENYIKWVAGKPDEAMAQHIKNVEYELSLEQKQRRKEKDLAKLNQVELDFSEPVIKVNTDNNFVIPNKKIIESFNAPIVDDNEKPTSPIEDNSEIISHFTDLLREQTNGITAKLFDFEKRVNGRIYKEKSRNKLRNAEFREALLRIKKLRAIAIEASIDELSAWDDLIASLNVTNTKVIN